MKYTYSFPKADVTVDAVVFGLGVEGVLSLLLVRRGRPKEPFFDHWALPGGFIDMDETLEGSLLRELREETGLILPYMEQLGAFGDPGRDPRGRVITIAYLALVPPAAVKGGDDAAEARWFPLQALPPLAFDHAAILEAGLARLRAGLMVSPIARPLLPESFSLGDLQRVYSAILDQPLDKRNFRRRINDLVEPTGERREGKHRPAILYRFR
ncbi:NUDIX hydrolase [Myxococcota bacterium]|nr:NUDIX hydrolase [Myxococcota bacterium]MBU1429705.1 NUDIX hydrolase [Myxococcota bacterium]